MVDKSEAEAVDLVLKLQEKLVSSFPSAPPVVTVQGSQKKGGGARKVACSISAVPGTDTLAPPTMTAPPPGKYSRCMESHRTGIPLLGREGQEYWEAFSVDLRSRCPFRGLLPGSLTGRRGLAVWLVPPCRSKPGAEASPPKRRRSSECVSTSPFWSSRCPRTSEPFCVARKRPVPAEGGGSSTGANLGGRGLFEERSWEANGEDGSLGGSRMAQLTCVAV